MAAYVTEAEAEAYFEDDPRAEDFLAADFAWYLTAATRHIDALPLRGIRYEPEYYESGVQADTNDDGLIQTLEFPRVMDGVVLKWDNATDLPIVPQQVKDACCEEALALYLEQAGGGSSRAALQEAGVQSYTIPGILQETFAPGAASANRNGGMRSPAAYRLLSRFIARSVPII